MMSDDLVILGMNFSYFTLRTAKPQKASTISTPHGDGSADRHRLATQVNVRTMLHDGDSAHAAMAASDPGWGERVIVWEGARI